MDRYKILLTGNNGIIMDDFFNILEKSFLIMSSSTRYADMEVHMACFKPNVFVLCLGSDNTEDDITRVMTIKRRLTRDDVIFGVVGTPGEIESFQKRSFNMADIVIPRPIKADKIKAIIEDHMEEVEKLQAQRSAMEEELNKVKNEDRRKHVLVIDDSPIMLKLVKEQLKDNYEVATAISGKIAYKFLESKTTDFILLDYEMPEEDGPQVLKRLRMLPNIDRVPIVFLTGVTDREKIKEALMLSPQGYVLKPIDKDKLIGTIEKFIGG